MHRPHDESVRAHPSPASPPSAAVPGLVSDGSPDPGRIDPAVLGALLDRHGWRRRGGAAGRYSRWSPPGASAGGTSLLVPESRTFPDCADLIGEALTALAHSSAPSARDVLIGLAVPSDEVRWWRDVPQGPAGTVAWTVQEQLRTAARGLLMAGALAARGPAGYHGARHRHQARALLEGVLVPPAPGGRSLTAFVPVATGRPAVAALHQALQAAREATDHQRATGRLDAYDSAVALGVSRELTEALIALVRGSEGAAVQTQWSPGTPRPKGLAGRSEPVEFTPGDLPALRAAGLRYLRSEPSVPVRLTGTVVRLRRAGPQGAGVVRLRVLAGAEVPHVRAALPEDAYRTAGHAHLAGVPIRLTGRLESRGGFRRLTDALDVAAVPVDAAERDRLLKSLREEPYEPCELLGE
ncbi:hypothetical protein [Streptomyces sp. NPDC047315]|uniref:hypothetical protein n=1 Tax=Streptomyces sp. NPDC047315 TaxID=3155142 RepID=UPI0033C3F2BA